MSLTTEQLLGRDESHLVAAGDSVRLCPEVVAAFARLQDDARAAGFELATASCFRSFERQLAIFNGKAAGERPVHDDGGRVLDALSLTPVERLHAILRFSALPGASRHHWGTDLDVYDANAMPQGYHLHLSPEEVAPGGMFDAMHCWLDARMEQGESHGFFRPYGEDRGGVAPERWHLSYAPLASGCEGALTPAVLQASWVGIELGLREEVERELAAIFARYVSVPIGWCPAASAG
ncbi:D-alanyl-D-alanine carboxypeptidase family protein [Halioglobus maricola]|uniref:D-alanyl-D-alanine carboxypeptidase family protein n=1 Tax=Halioglobus maricola TaxID=2601894 RepID=A0A5P9NPA0_9GAMM|nr:M15 family metallopeptidase [Halioglobus maricola]QFU77094.1 D-alanyl-D-alanine carboxypeptidase family protein [Halioglobus maricola]